MDLDKLQRVCHHFFLPFSIGFSISVSRHPVTLYRVSCEQRVVLAILIQLPVQVVSIF